MRTILSTNPSEFIGRTVSFLWGGLEHDERGREIVAVRERNPRARNAKFLRSRRSAAVEPETGPPDVVQLHFHFAPTDPARFIASAQRLERRFLGGHAN